jgi:prepilin-type N-terminal cleavage/methylation domain-containing protein
MKPMRRKMGFSLIETLTAMAVSSILVAAMFSFYGPSVHVFASVMASEGQKSDRSDAMAALETEAITMGAIYVDPTQCYALCMVDSASSSRVYYYWDPKAGPGAKTMNLYRKKESTINPISCKGGSVFARNLDTATTSFAMSKDLLNVTLAGTGPSSSNPQKLFQISDTIFPSVQERQIIFSEGFECATLRQGWTVVKTSGANWSIQTSTHQGSYQVSDSESSNGVNTTTLTTPIDLSRTSSAHITFNFMNGGTISNPDAFSLLFYDGSAWWTVYQYPGSGNNAGAVPAPQTINADLSGYKLASTNQIQFVGTLHNAGSRWYLDGIQVFTP